LHLMHISVNIPWHSFHLSGLGRLSPMIMGLLGAQNSMGIVKRSIKKLIGNTGPYKFASWAINKYLEEEMLIYKPGQFKECGQGVFIDRPIYINFPDRVILKDKVHIFRDTMINSRGGLYIGQNTGISNRCVILTDQHRYIDSDKIPFDNVVELKPVVIRDFVWIGIGVMILPGVEIGEGAIIGMGSVVARDVPPLAIMLGNPAKVIGHRSKEHFESCKATGKYQDIIITKHEESLLYMHRVKFERELKELGIMK
jgi:maltose O-acetyltransferase